MWNIEEVQFRRLVRIQQLSPIFFLPSTFRVQKFCVLSEYLGEAQAHDDISVWGVFPALSSACYFGIMSFRRAFCMRQALEVRSKFDQVSGGWHVAQHPCVIPKSLGQQKFTDASRVILPEESSGNQSIAGQTEQRNSYRSGENRARCRYVAVV